jgi:hypothetical protein
MTLKCENKRDTEGGTNVRHAALTLHHPHMSLIAQRMAWLRKKAQNEKAA